MHDDLMIVMGTKDPIWSVARRVVRERKSERELGITGSAGVRRGRGAPAAE